MAATASDTDKQVTPSRFYLACRNGDFTTVQELLPTMSHEEKNRFEPNGSTALHVATFNGHHAIVKLLLDNGRTTWTLNKYGNTPYDEAQGDEMRRLFDRPNRNGSPNGRFVSAEDCFQMISCEEQADVEDDNIPKNNYVSGYKHIGTF
ncbi:hypothetical protein I4U23_004049 [Adineta vaga]|nr:hypothetical protein I4U23_004049 [Adineta vaga]